MAKSTELKPVTEDYCDFCELPQTYPVRACAICKREMCSRGENGGDGHAAFSILKLTKLRARAGDEDEERSRLYICKECEKKTINLPLGKLFDGLMKGGFSFEPFLVRRGC